VIPASPNAQDAGKGFMFGAPSGSFRIDAGWAVAAAGSDLFSFTTNELTLDDEISARPHLAGNWPQCARPHAARAYGKHGRDEQGLRVPGLVDNNESPFRDHTFSAIPLTVGLKEYLTPPACRSAGCVGTGRLAPYVAPELVPTWYQFKAERRLHRLQHEQRFNDLYESTGWAPTG